ncbi:SH3 domain-containing protein [Rhodobacteraceae bacterium B1Z28]|uniref:SH3 domain-containing protein n=1 Tax=Ruegeria haliotis TaxID=2747601 RepID=A0ABX2PNW3_9RHOB|nr:SH3 domain-containing protein [Ruegeria haliotis]NVO55424.1 SH3 domain-containing protein [Ruegeria haliotis]
MKLALVLLAALICGPALADRQSFPPVDQAGRDPSLVAFRDDLLAKVAARDTEAVIAAACPDIYISHGLDSGPDAFRTSLTVPPDSLAEENRDQADEMRDAYWTALEDTLSQPGYFDDQGEFWMPHQWQITLPASLDPLLAYYVTGEKVTLRQTPSRGAGILSLISHEVVLIPDYQDGSEYQSVRLTDGTPGYIHSDFLWSMVGYRAALIKSKVGDWQLCTFVAGD